MPKLALALTGLDWTGDQLRRSPESAFIELLNLAEQFTKFWLRGELPAIGLEDRLIDLGFHSVEFCDFGRVRAKYLNAVIPLGRW